MLEGIQLKVAPIILEALEPYGFALGGGLGLQAYGLINRPSYDIDSFTDRLDAGMIAAAEKAVITKLEDAGFTVTTKMSDSYTKFLNAFHRESGESIEIDLSYDYRTAAPKDIGGLGAVISLQDLVIGKLRAFWDRQAPRDYLDISNLLNTGVLKAEEIYDLLKTVRPEAAQNDLAERFLSIDSIKDSEFALYDKTTAEIEDMRNTLHVAAGCISGSHTKTAIAPAADRIANAKEAAKCSKENKAPEKHKHHER